MKTFAPLLQKKRDHQIQGTRQASQIAAKVCCDSLKNIPRDCQLIKNYYEFITHFRVNKE